jgi:hypothetical protein
VDWWSKDRFSVGAAYSYMRRDGEWTATRIAGSEFLRTRPLSLRASWNY